jgi:protein TonB
MNFQACMTIPGSPNSDDLPLRDRSLVVGLVVLVHALVFLSYTWSSSQSISAPREMSISLAMPNQQQTAAVTQKPQERPKPVKPEPQADVPDVPIETPDPSPPVESAPPQPENVSPGLLDREPDYQAAYLNNPLPGYPMVARRMGWQGKVVLEVEVLESGLPGQIRVHQSSGRDVLDNAAMQAVRGWRFVPARKNGQVVAKRFLVPIPFVLKESE